MSATRVQYVTEDGRSLATWGMDGRPQVGDQVHLNHGANGTWQVLVVQHCGNMNFRCVCVPAQSK